MLTFKYHIDFIKFIETLPIEDFYKLFTIVKRSNYNKYLNSYKLNKHVIFLNDEEIAAVNLLTFEGYECQPWFRIFLVVKDRGWVTNGEHDLPEAFGFDLKREDVADFISNFE